MGIDAVALLRPKKRSVLRKHRSHLMPLDDGSVLFLTLMRYRDFEADPVAARVFFESELGCALGEIQDDARGVFMFPDVAEPRATTYDGVVAEIGEDGFWVPLRGSATPRTSRPTVRQDPFAHRAVREVPTDAPRFSGDVAELEHLAGSFVRIAPDAEVWCLLVHRKTALPSRALARLAKGSVVLPDKSTAIHGKHMETLDALSTRLSNEYAPWIAEHEDPRGVPVFRFGASHRIQGASSYDDALARLGDDVRWVEGEKPKKAKKTATKKKATKKKATKKKATKKKVRAV